MLKNLPEEVLTLWNYWEIRGVVLLSLLLQTILIICGPLRKTIARIRILVWSAYLSADTVATFALANLARSQGDSSCDGSKNANNSIQAFWAPFLLLHLGGPDTITAYSIEDNELWLRHLLGLVVQVGLAFYVFSRSWGSGILQFIAIPMFIVGIIKYSERTWVLWSSSSKSLRKNSYLRDFRSYCERPRNPESESDQQGECLRQAYTFFHISMFTMQDHAPGYKDLMLSYTRFSKIPAKDAFKVVEAELGLIYDMLYTKTPLIYSRSGIILRCISFLLSVTVFIIFPVKIEKHAYSSIDVAITYLLLAAAVFFELYAFLCLVFSDRTMIWLLDNGGNALTSAIYSRLRKLTTSKRWSRSITKYNLIRVCTENKAFKCLELVGIEATMRQMHVNRKELNVELQNFILEHLLKKAEKMTENFKLFDKNWRSEIIGQRGDGVLKRHRALRKFEWCTTKVEFIRSILVWHVATEILSCNGNDASNVSRNEKDARNVSKCLSEYMIYLLVIRPNMLSKGFFYDEYLNTLIRDLRGMDISRLDTVRPRYDDETFRKEWKKKKYSAVKGGCVLARQLSECKFSSGRWEVIEEVWMEMLTYAAAHCPWKEHAHALRRGGELLTHVCFLMLHLGLSEQYEVHPSNVPLQTKRQQTKRRQQDLKRRGITIARLKRNIFYSLDEKNKKEEFHYYFQARDKYLHDIESSTPDEVKQLEETIADKDRELEQKERVLERFRASLTASTPQQGIDSLPGSLPAQTESQGTGQSPLKNNEISLCMD